MIKKLLLLFCLLSTSAYATQVTVPTTWSDGDSVTAAKLNSINSTFANTINGALDNTNANTTSGYFFYKKVSALPSAGTQGSVYFLTSDNSMNFDTGSTFSKAVTVSSPSSSQVPVYNGSAWIPTSITNLGFTSGMIMLWSGTIATIPSGWVLCDGNNSTPDLRDRFIVGAKQDSSGAKTNLTGSLTQSGGSTTITQGNLPSYNLTSTRLDGNGGGLTGIQGTNNGANSTSFNISSGGSGTVYTQPYYALAYIQKT